jgi:hypothetical protein
LCRCDTGGNCERQDRCANCNTTDHFWPPKPYYPRPKIWAIVPTPTSVAASSGGEIRKRAFGFGQLPWDRSDFAQIDDRDDLIRAHPAALIGTVSAPALVMVTRNKCHCPDRRALSLSIIPAQLRWDQQLFPGRCGRFACRSGWVRGTSHMWSRGRGGIGILFHWPRRFGRGRLVHVVTLRIQARLALWCQDGRRALLR